MSHDGRSLGLGTALLGWLVVGCGTPAEPDATERLGMSEQPVSAPLDHAFCTIPVLGRGTKSMEEDYLPHVITCENGGAGREALEAQAIAARSVAYYAMATSGHICDGQGCQVYSCGAQPQAKHYAAVRDTAGMYLSHSGMLTYGFYVSGDADSDPPSCHGSPSDAMEHFVTYNEGKTGAAVSMTSLGYMPNQSIYGQNRGCMSQWGARCLESHKGYGHERILKFYYGADIGIRLAQGACTGGPDEDGDGIVDAQDNCRKVENSGQRDTDSDGKGDACDRDDDDDGIEDADDNCRKVENSGQKDTDSDGKGDACDRDDDDDGIEDADDNCRKVENSGQKDTDSDGRGDPCDDDDDDDGLLDVEDNCPKTPNAGQKDTDSDGRGDKCDQDDDGDDFTDDVDNCVKHANPEQVDSDSDGKGDACDDDDDDDGVVDAEDVCALVADPEQLDADSDGLGDACDLDQDADGTDDDEDNCPALDNPSQSDLDEDGLGDECDEDDDGDGVADETDNCPTVANAARQDSTGDGCGNDEEPGSEPDSEPSAPPGPTDSSGCSVRPLGARGGAGLSWLLGLVLAGCWRRRLSQPAGMMLPSKRQK